MNSYLLPLSTKMRPKAYSIVLPFLAVIILSACKSTTLFQSNFDATANNQPPATAQQIGTVNTDGPAGSVVVIPSPVTTGGKWVQITRLANPQTVSGLQCNFIKAAGAGQSTFSAILFIPSGSGLVTIQFESFGQPVGTLTNFLHLDFTQDNKVRLDDNDATKFGTFPRNQAFIVQVTLNINATAPTAHIVLSGAGASGIVDYNILSPFINLAQQFGAVRLWMGFPWAGSFDGTNILVTKRSN